MVDTRDPIFWRDEILQIMYWLRGESLGEVVSSPDILVFLDASEEQVEFYLEQLVADGFATQLNNSPALYQLTELGVKEGGRRFAEEFSSLTKQAHGECNNPNCDCKTMGPEACITHASHSH